MIYQNIVLDCDTGRDDALAIHLFFALDMPLQAVVSTSGNVGIDHVINNNLRLLSLLGQGNVPVFKGVTSPVNPSQFFDEIVLKRHRTLGNGMSDVILPETAVSLDDRDVTTWIKGVVSDHGKIDYVVTGPATTLADLLTKLDKPTDYIRSITMMGGKFDPLWSELNNGPDFNIAADPEAFQIVLQSGVPFTLVPMNTTFPICIGLEDLQNLEPKTELARWFKEIMVQHILKFAPEPFFRFHDPMVPMLMADEGAMTNSRTVSLKTDCDDLLAFSRLIDDENGTPITVYDPVPSPSDMVKRILGLLGF